MGEADALAAVLVAGNLRNDLRGDVAGGGKTVRLFDQRAGDDRAVLQHVVQIDQIAVVHMLGIVIRVVEMDDALLVRLDDLARQQQAARDIPADLAGHIIALHAVDRGILVGVFLLGLLVVAFDQAEDLVVGGVGAADERALIAVADIALGNLKRAVPHDFAFYELLNLLDAGRAVHLQTDALHRAGNILNLRVRQLRRAAFGPVGLLHGVKDLYTVEHGLRAVAFDELHIDNTFPSEIIQHASV